MTPKKTIRTARTAHAIDFADVIHDGHLITVSAGHGLDPLMLSLKQPPDYRIERSGGSFPRRQAARPNDFSVHYLMKGDWHTVELEPTSENFHCVQPLGKDKWLLVRGRAGGSDDNNATVYDMRGHRLWSFHAGDGIEDVQTTEARTIWLSYFDEGVYSGNDLGSAGLVCLDEQGKVLFRYDSLYAQHHVPVIDDCYALNVCSAKEVWLYYYNSFPLIKLVDGRVAQSWHPIPVSGSHAFAVAPERVLFCGSYNKRKALFQIDLESMSMGELRPLTPEGQPIEGFRGFGRRSRLFLSTGESLYSLDLDSFRMNT